MALGKSTEQKISDIHAFIEVKQVEIDRRLGDLEVEDGVLHGRINSSNRWFTGLLLSSNTAWGAFLVYLKIRS